MHDPDQPDSGRPASRSGVPLRLVRADDSGAPDAPAADPPRDPPREARMFRLRPRKVVTRAFALTERQRIAWHACSPIRDRRLRGRYEPDERMTRDQHRWDAMLARLIERWPTDVRRECLSLPLDEDPIFALLCQVRPGGASMAEMGDAYGLSRERIRQIEAVALARVASDLSIRQYREHLEGLSRKPPTLWESIALSGDE